ncbi:MAG: hypothetical protein ABI451_09085 [Dokdonella sp.]
MSPWGVLWVVTGIEVVAHKKDSIERGCIDAASVTMAQLPAAGRRWIADV